MSAKWVRSQAWEREHLVGLLTPVRYLLHTFSTIWFAVILLVGVAVYGTLASVPIGMLAQIPTYLIYGLTFLLVLGVVWLAPAWATWNLMGPSRGRGGARFVVVVVMSIVLIGLGSYAWVAAVWPHLKWEPSSGHGFMLFGEFVEKYKSTTLRRLPGVEMTELEFYAWWPLKWLLVMFVINMVTATIRRIDFAFEKIGVLSVHFGIVIMALGSVWYAAKKLEGDVLLVAGPLGEDGKISPGPVETGFYDNIRVVLRARQVRSDEEKKKLGIEHFNWEQRPLVGGIGGLPRYNDYGLDAAGTSVSSSSRSLSIDVPRDEGKLVDGDIAFRVIGYATYAEMVDAWRDAGGGGGNGAVRELTVMTSLDERGVPVPGGPMKPHRTLTLNAGTPSERLAILADALGIELTKDTNEARWSELSAELPKGAAGGLIVEIPASGNTLAVSRVYAIEQGKKITVGEGENGWTLEVRETSPHVPFPIVTPTHKGADSSVAIVRVTPPVKSGLKPFDRWLYSRFPELSQDLSATETNERGMPKRGPASEAIRLTYVDASIVQVHVDQKDDGTFRSIVRLPGGGADSLKRQEKLKEGDSISVAPALSVLIGKGISNAEKVRVPRSVPEERREREFLGTHKKSAAAVEVRSTKPGMEQWKRVVWVAFSQYDQSLSDGGDALAAVTLPDGRTVELAFGRLWHAMPIGIQLLDFEMFPYPHSTQPRDFRSDVRITHGGVPSAQETRYTSLNDPLLVDVGDYLTGRFKFSQSGWDSEGWMRTKAEADAGRLPRPIARFTILGVGTNPGIHVIAGGAILTVLGIPWAFYIKPWLVKRKSERLRAAISRGERLV